MIRIVRALSSWRSPRVIAARARARYRRYRRTRETPVLEVALNREGRRFQMFRSRRSWAMVPIGEEADTLEDVKYEGDGPLSLFAPITASGEMAAEAIPLGIPQGEYDALLENNDDKPREVVVEVAPGKSKRGWNYQRTALARIAGEVNSGGLPGYKGHQKPDEVAHRFVDPVTHWIGARESNGKFYFRGVVDRSAGELKGWIRAGRVTQVSIFGFPVLKRTATGEIHVVDYEPISIDWTPLKRAGMPTRIVSVGEMDSILKPGEQPDPTETKPKEGKPVETLQEWAAKGRELGIEPDKAIGELKWSADDVAKAAGLEVVTDDQKETLKVVGEMATKLGIGEKDGKLDLVKMGERVDGLLKLDEAQRTSERDKTIEKVVGEMVANDKGQKLVLGHSKISALGEAATEDEIKKAVGEVLADDTITLALKGFGFTPQIDPKGEQNGGGNSNGSSQHSRRVKRSI